MRDAIPRLFSCHARRFAIFFFIYARTVTAATATTIRRLRRCRHYFRYAAPALMLSLSLRRLNIDFRHYAAA